MKEESQGEKSEGVATLVTKKRGRPTKPRDSSSENQNGASRSRCSKRSYYDDEDWYPPQTTDSRKSKPSGSQNTYDMTQSDKDWSPKSTRRLNTSMGKQQQLLPAELLDHDVGFCIP